jgi:hypothetical protein
MFCSVWPIHFILKEQNITEVNGEHSSYRNREVISELSLDLEVNVPRDTGSLSSQTKR